MKEKPTHAQRKALCEMLHWAFLEIRAHGYSGKAEQAGDLADAFHNLPAFMPTDFKDWDRDWFRRDLKIYQEDYGDSPDFVEMLDRAFAE